MRVRKHERLPADTVDGFRGCLLELRNLGYERPVQRVHGAR